MTALQVERNQFRSPWVDLIPFGWDQVKLGHISKIYSGGTPDKKVEEYWTNGTVPWLNSGTVNQGLITEVSEFISEQALANSSARWVPAGSLVMALAGQGKTKGMVAQLGIDATCNQSMAAIVLDEDHSRYMMYWLSSNYRNIRGIASDDTRDGLNLTNLKSIPCPRPPIDEQIAIAAYLDAETKRIDELINEKKQLIELLKEQKAQAAESVIEPTKYGSTARLGYFVDLLPGYSFSSDDFNRNIYDVKLLRGVNVAPGVVRWDDCVYWPRSEVAGLDRFRLKVGDVVFGMDRPWISSGPRVAMIDENSVDALLVQRVCRLRNEGAVTQRFVFYVLASDRFRQSIEFELSGISVPHISPEQITRFRIPVLPMAEQHRRTDFADAEIGRIDALVAHTLAMIDLLYELRSSTITDAVLGRIDVRKNAKIEPAREAIE